MKQNYSNESVESVLAVLKTRQAGLNASEIKTRQAEAGFNEIITKPVSLFRVFLKQYGNFLMILLFAGALISLYLGSTVDGMVILAILLINGLLGTMQEYKAEQLTAALRTHIPQTVTVRRSGKEIVIVRRELVVGDIVMLSSGQVVPADLRLIKNFGVVADESILTGESAGVVKKAEEVSEKAIGNAKTANILWGGSVIAEGGGEAVVIAVGNQTQFGKIVNYTHNAKKESSFLAQIHSLSTFLLRTTVIATAVLLVVMLFFKPQFGASNIFLFIIALTIGLVPEMLPLISTVALSGASLELIKHGVLIKRLTAIEDLGSVEIFCTDKTGTITENKLRVTEVIADDKEGCFHAALLTAHEMKDSDFLLAGSFDAALWNYAGKKERETAGKNTKLWESSFDPNNRWQFVVIKKGAGANLIVKGSPESVLAASTITKLEKQKLLLKIGELGKSGLRALAVAKKVVPAKKSYDSAHVTGLKFLGFIVFEDPIKPTAAESLERAKNLGIKIKILTGDSPEVALHVAQKAGMEVHEFDVITGFAIIESSPEHRIEMIRRASIFARVSPEQKYEIIQVLGKNASVMFLGEGVNDAPALKSADVGMVVEEASDIAKESADIILTKADLGVIIESIHVGRQIMANIVKYIMITLTGNFGSFYAVSIMALISPILPLLPTQVLVENILTDIPMFGTIRAQVPRKEQRHPFHYSIRGVGFAATILGLVVLSSQLVFYFMFSHLSLPLFRTLWLLEVVLIEFSLVISLRTTDWFWKAGLLSVRMRLFFAFVILFTLLLPFIPYLSLWLHLEPYPPIYLVPIAVIVSSAMLLVELVKKLLFHSSFFHHR